MNTDGDDKALKDDDPRSIGPYKVLRRLGQGGMGIVFLAEDSRLHRQVAVKVLPPEMAVRDDLIERFSREAEAVSKLQHPGIVPIYELGRDGPWHYFVMPWIRGISLSGYVKLLKSRRARGKEKDQDLSGPVTDGHQEEEASAALKTQGATDLWRLLQIFETVALALDHAHQQGIIHRDIKPSNIIVDADGGPHVLDFGLAHVVGEETRSVTEKFTGTLPYMAPEQVSPNKGQLDARTDVYALGVTLYECLCGRRPFEAAGSEALMFQILMKQPPAPRQLGVDLARDIETIVLKCLEKDPDRRYPSARAFADDLKRFREHRDIEARPVGRLGQLLRWAELNRTLALVMSLAIIAVVALLGLLIVNAYEARQERKRLKVYEHFISRARELEQQRDATRASLARQQDLVKRLEREVPGHASPSSLRKKELFAARAHVRKLQEELDTLQGEIEYNLQRSREAVEAVNLNGRERIDLYITLLQDARRRRDRVAQTKIKLFLQDAGVDLRAPLEGQITIVTNPPDAQATAYPLRDDIGGVRQLNQRDAVDLGRTPVEGADLPAGSWLVTLNHPGHMTVFLPVLIEPGEHWGSSQWHGGRFADRDWTVRMPAQDAFDRNQWCYVPAGPFQGSPAFNLDPQASLEWYWVDSFLIGRQEMHFAEYEDYLRDEATISRIIRSAKEKNVFIHVPRLEPTLPIFQIDGHGNLGPGATWGEMPPRPYDAGFVLSGLSLSEFEDYLRWRNERRSDDVPPLRLPHSREWEKAARGVDGRTYPWGNQFDWAYTFGRYSKKRASGPAAWQYHAGRSGLFPTDTSIFGCVDMAGNVAEWCLDGPAHDDFKDQHWVMGGSFGWNAPTLFTTWPQRSYPFGHVDYQFGFRLARNLK